MLYAEKGNKVKNIDESQIDACVAQGYTIYDESGRVIRETIPTGVAELRLAYTQNAEEIARLKAQIVALEAELEVAKAQVAAKSVKAAPPAPASEEVTEENPKPKRTRKVAE